jgi:hypothetical protein
VTDRRLAEVARPVCVVYLVRSSEGLEPLRGFISSYLEHSPGIEHELVLLFKGFADHSAAAAHRELADGHQARELFVPDRGFDLTAYRFAAEALDASRYCFLNSHARVLSGGWLAHLDRALSTRGVGLAGASGSWASLLSFALLHLRLPGGYTNVYENPRAAIREFSELDRDRGGAGPSSSLMRAAFTAIALAGNLRGFERFPAHHVRTNAFIVGHETFMRVSRANLRTKVQAHRLESGKASITHRTERLGLRAVVVDGDGHMLEHPDWPASHTFWQGRQDGLMVSDNQTEAYRRGGPERRLLLSRYAWGNQAAPVPG